jgi:hypothetical protein
VSTGEIVAVTVGAVALTGTIIFVLNRQNQAAVQAQAAAAAAAARAAAGARHNDFDLGKALTDLGGALLDKGIAYFAGGAPAVLASQAQSKAVMV